MKHKIVTYLANAFSMYLLRSNAQLNERLKTLLASNQKFQKQIEFQEELQTEYLMRSRALMDENEDILFQIGQHNENRAILLAEQIVECHVKH